MGDKQNCFVNRKIKSLFLLLSRIILDFPDGSDGKASAYNAGDPGSVPGLGRSSGEGNVLLPRKSHGQRRVVGYSLWGRRVGHN